MTKSGLTPAGNWGLKMTWNRKVKIKGFLGISVAQVLMLLAACGGGESTASVDVSLAMAEESTTTTTIDPAEIAASHYLEIVRPNNCAFDLFFLAEDEFIATQESRWTNEWNYDADAQFASLKSEVLENARILSETMVTFATELGIFDWPIGVQESVDLLIAQTLEEASAYSAFSKPDSMEQVRAWEWPVVDDRNHAGVIRAKLGLPSNIDNDVEECNELFGKL